MTDSTDRESTKSGNHHCNFFRSSFDSVEQVKALLRLAFSTDELRHFYLATIAFEKRDWLDSNRLAHRFADLVVSVRLKEGQNLSVTLVVEHKSSPDSNLMEQLLYYQSLIYANEADSVAPPPLVVYHGKLPGRLYSTGFASNANPVHFKLESLFTLIEPLLDSLWWN